MDTNVSSIDERRDITKEERMKLRTELIGEKACYALDFQRRAIKKFGPPAGIFLRQLVFWDGSSAAEDGWMWKSRREMEDETGLNQKQQEKARKALGAAGVLEEEVRPRGPLKRQTMHYRPDLLKIMELLPPRDDSGTGNPIASQVPETLEGVQYRKPYSDSGIQKSTAEEKPSEEDVQGVGDSPDGSRPAPHQGSFTKERDARNDLNSVGSRSSVDTATDEQVERALAFFEKQLKAMDLPAMKPKDRKRARRELEMLVNGRGIGKDKLRAVFRRMLERRPNFPLMPLDAHDDVEDRGHPDLSAEDFKHWRETGEVPSRPSETWWIDEYGDIWSRSANGPPSRFYGIPPATAPEEVRRRAYEIEVEENLYANMREIT